MKKQKRLDDSMPGIFEKLAEFITKKRTVKFGQDPNGMHWAEIKENGAVVSATTKLTSDEIQKWIYEQNIQKNEYTNVPE